MRYWFLRYNENFFEALPSRKYGLFGRHWDDRVFGIAMSYPQKHYVEFMIGTLKRNWCVCDSLSPMECPSELRILL